MLWRWQRNGSQEMRVRAVRPTAQIPAAHMSWQHLHGPITVARLTEFVSRNYTGSGIRATQPAGQ